MSSPCMWGSMLGGSAALATVSTPPGLAWARARRGTAPVAPIAAVPARNWRRETWCWVGRRSAMIGLLPGLEVAWSQSSPDAGRGVKASRPSDEGIVSDTAERDKPDAVRASCGPTVRGEAGVREEHSKGHDVLQLAHVSGPGVPAQRRPGRRHQSLRGQPRLRARLSREPADLDR